MSEQWYCLAFGIELGPMSRDDLRMLASRGEVLPDTQVRQGPAGSWVAARTVADLFPSGNASSVASRWYYEFLGEVLGPMSLEDLRLLAEQGTVRPESRVREGARGAWKAASMVPELFRSAKSAAAEGDADFEVSAPHFVARPANAAQRAAAPKQEDVAPQRSSQAPDSDDADFDLGPPAATG
jgi:hypothetical protein